MEIFGKWPNNQQGYTGRLTMHAIATEELERIIRTPIAVDRAGKMPQGSIERRARQTNNWLKRLSR